MARPWSDANKAGIALAILTTTLALLWSGPSAALTGERTEGIRLSEVGRGSLLFRGEGEDLYLPAPVLATNVRIRVSGMIARVEVSQRFRNPGRTWREGVYVFPLPENAAVDRLRLVVAGRIIEGRIKEREAARRTYEKARAEGRKAGLVEQERPNIFTISVANIAPGEEVTVEIVYQQSLRFDAGQYRLRFPMVVGPRYIPGHTRVAGLAGAGWAANTDQVADAARLTPPARLPPEGLANPVSLEIELDAGVPLALVESAYLGISHRPAGAKRVRIDVEGDALPADRDLDLAWTPVAGAQPAAALFAESVDGAGYVLGMVLPPASEAMAAPPPRDAIFVIDTSGSMSGASLSQAKAALRLGLDGLRAGDRFNVIQFNSQTSALFDAPRPADATNLERARRYVEGLQAEGGTEMMAALEAALDGRDHPGRLRQVVFLTDGSIGNEAALFKRIADRLGDSRLFTVGIGSAPNGYFMTRAAKFGRGTYTYIGEVDQVAERMGALLAKLERPALTDLEVRWPDGVRAEMWPARLPDLYAGEPVIFAAKLAGDAFARGGEVVISGRLGGRPWRASLEWDAVASSGAVSHPGVAAVWARRKIAALMESKLDGAEPEVIRAAVVEVALAHRLVSRYTSLVAVDVTPVRPANATLSSQAVPVNLPAGWEYAKVFGALPRTATPAGPHLALGALLLLAAMGLWWRRRRALAGTSA